MKKLTIREARQALSHLEELLSVEGEVVITRRGQPIAQVVPIVRKRLIPSHRDLREKMREVKIGSEKLLREERDVR
jgi:antitoxin (DNA-binding transcriptional repressor) of toxin-antitoxin stability system